MCIVTECGQGKWGRDLKPLREKNLDILEKWKFTICDVYETKRFTWLDKIVKASR